MTRPLRVLFVCTGNVCRSPLAEALLRHKLEQRNAVSRFEIDSVGTTAEHLGQDADPRMRDVAARNSIRFNHRARKVTRRELSEADLIVAMDQTHRETIRRRLNDESAAKRVRMFREFDPHVLNESVVPDVPDPWYGGMEGFERVFEIVDRTCEYLADRLTDNLLGGGDHDLQSSDS